MRLRLPAAFGPYWNSAWIWVLPMSLPMLIVTVTGLVVLSLPKTASSSASDSSC